MAKSPSSKKKIKKSAFAKARSTEATYARALRGVAREVGKLIKGFGTITPEMLPALANTLARYAEVIDPWAKSKAAAMLAQTNRQDKRAWKKATENLSIGIRTAIQTTPIGARMQELMGEQVKLIKSLPTEAAERVHKLVIENVGNQSRAKEIAKEISRSGEVTTSRATTIARTEVARASSLLTQSRAEYVGSDGYIWRTAHDSDVRHSHRKMEGKFVKWDNPPTLDGLTGHAGQLPNCRCYPEPVIPKELL